VYGKNAERDFLRSNEKGRKNHIADTSKSKSRLGKGEEPNAAAKGICNKEREKKREKPGGQNVRVLLQNQGPGDRGQPSLACSEGQGPWTTGRGPRIQVTPIGPCGGESEWERTRPGMKGTGTGTKRQRQSDPNLRGLMPAKEGTRDVKSKKQDSDFDIWGQ